MVYQPAGNFWPIQWAEAALYLAASALLAGFCVWWTRARLTEPGWHRWTAAPAEPRSPSL